MRCIAVVLLVVAFVPARVLARPKGFRTRTLDSLSLKLYSPRDAELMGILRFNTFPTAGLVVFAERPVNISTTDPLVVALHWPRDTIHSCNPGVTGKRNFFFWTKLPNINNNLDFVTSVNHEDGKGSYDGFLNSIVILFSMKENSHKTDYAYDFTEPYGIIACGIITDNDEDNEDFRTRLFPVKPLTPYTDQSALMAMKWSLIYMLLAIIVFIIL